MAKQEGFLDSVGQLVVDMTDSAENIHRRLASLPLDVLDDVLGNPNAVNRVRDVQNEAIGSVYELARGIEREVMKALSGAMDSGAGVLRRVEPEARAASA